jgi:Calx-beta domain
MFLRHMIRTLERVVRTRRPPPRRRRFRPDHIRLEERALLALTIQFDYRFDVGNFFTPARRTILQLAASNIANQINDGLSAITPSGLNTWSEVFQSPATGAAVTIPNPTVPANTIVVYVGARPLAGTEAGFGGAGGFTATGTPAWLDSVQARGQAGALLQTPTDFGPWGGAISFDNANTNWYFNAVLSGIGPNQLDFLSVAEHEIGHVLGIGDLPQLGEGPTSWSRFISAGTFIGPASEAAHGNTPVPLDLTGNHWAQGTLSDGAPAAMTPVLTAGTRKLFTRLDFWGLIDAGWQVTVPTQISTIQFATASATVSQNAGTISITVTRTGATTTGVSVHFAAIDGAAHSGADYSVIAGILPFNPGASTATFNVTIIPSPSALTSTSFSLVLNTPSLGAQIGSPNAETITILHPHPPIKETLPDDFDGDGKTDISVYRPPSGLWLINMSTAGPVAVSFGQPGDIPLQGDFDHSGKQEFAVYRPSTAQWLIVKQSGLVTISFGQPNVDIPVPADYDGDGVTDLAVYRRTTAQWFILQSGAGPRSEQFGQPNVDAPVPADYDGDGQADLALYRPTTAQWLFHDTTAGYQLTSFGQANVDKPIPADFDGDGKTDLAVFRPTTADWLIMRSTAGAQAVSFGQAGVDVPIPQDYDGDGRADLAVYRPTTAQWLMLQSTAGPRVVQFGQAIVDAPLPAPLSYRFLGGLSRASRSASLSADIAEPAATSQSTPVEVVANHVAKGASRRRRDVVTH